MSISPLRWCLTSIVYQDQHQNSVASRGECAILERAAKLLKWKGTPTPTTKTLLRRCYEAFNRRDLDGALTLMHPDMTWPNGWEDAWVHGKERCRASSHRKTGGH